MKFSSVSVGDKWHCPWCGRTALEIIGKRREVAKCLNPRCLRVFRVYILALPDPNGKTGNKECGSKFKHDTVESAFNHADELTNDIPHRAQKDLLIYRCRFCDKYHVGHGGKVKKKRLNEFYLYTQLKQDVCSKQGTTSDTPNIGKPLGKAESTSGIGA